jgi:hypothetical protein
MKKYSTYNISRYSKLLDKYYKKKIKECSICHNNNKCTFDINITKSDNLILQSVKQFNCLNQSNNTPPLK